jgi:GTPase SAR1 family protein
LTLRTSPLWRGSVSGVALFSTGAGQRCFFSFSRASRVEENTGPKKKAAASLKPVKSSASSSSLMEADAGPASAAAPAVATTSSHTEFQSELESKLIALRQLYLEPYDSVYHFLNPLKSTTPMVMLLGNHSSGKSTLINYIAGREIQETGVAPTDDGFTVIKRDSFDMDSDGPSMVSNPKYQYQALQQFGISFVTHFKMKTRTMAATSRVPMNMVLVDTPGMIDTPLHSSETVTMTSNAGDSIYGSDHTRGYDFLGVTRWFAQQSDVILLMFDPANPGTTGETLDVLTKSLAGYEHKFLLVMNKADVFKKVTDFARAYGTLCWNLSKVMKMKDIPRVYTTCTPLDKNAKVMTDNAMLMRSETVPDAELSRQRNEIMDEIMSAPIRRMDNLITETEDSARNLLLAVRAAKVLRQDYRQRELVVYSALASACLFGPAIAVVLSSVSLTGTALLTLLSVAVGCGGLVAVRAYLKECERKILDTSDYVLSRLFTAKTRTKDVELRWQRIVKPEMMRVVATCHDNGASGITTLPTCSARACRGIETMLNDEVPLLRRAVTEYKEAYFRGKGKSAPRSIE